MKILFIDFDGVIVHSKYEHGRDVDPACLARVRRICKESGAQVVIHSTWVYLHTPEELKGYVSGLAEHLHPDFVAKLSAGRGLDAGKIEAIQEWLDAHPRVEYYAILEDEMIGDMKKYPIVWIPGGFYRQGIQHHHATIAVRVLNGEMVVNR
jgi:hypothetical protein